MIVTSLLILLYVIVDVLTMPLLLLGDVSMNSSFTTALSTGLSYYANMALFFPPSSTLLTIIVLIATMETAIATYKIIMWVVRRIPGQS